MQTTKSTFTYSDTTGGGSDGGTDDGGMTGGGGSGGGGDGTGGGGGNGGNGVTGNNHISPSSGCSMGGGDSSVPSIVSLLLVLGALGFALRRQRS